ncbi:hypothetical protein FRC17_000942 [Serendipita sp. 399]|nr:hypothetical protein FRC17_000942 [Serendipita sp. 399]
MIIGRIAYIRKDNQCVIGLQRGSSLTMLIIDLLVNVLLTGMFLWPLWSSSMLSPNLRRVASRTVIASGAALTISATNMTILTILHGHELGWICLGSCTTDVVVNALVLFWLTRPGQAMDEPTSHGGYGGNHGPGHRTEPSKSGAVHMQRISGAPGHLGSFQGTTSANGVSRSSTTAAAIKFKSELNRGGSDLESSGPRSPMKLQFDSQPYSEVYDGSQPFYGRRTPNSLLNGDEKRISLPPTPTTPSVLNSAGLVVSPPPTAYRDQRRHSSGIVYEQRISTEDGTDRPAGGAFLSRMILGRRTNASDGARTTSPMSVRSSQTTSAGNIVLTSFGNLAGRRRAAKASSVDELGVKVTVMTHLEDDVELAEDVSAGRAANKKQPLPPASSSTDSDLTAREPRS